jgi:hypothetical protein
MAQLKFKRKLGTVFTFELTWKDRTGARQQLPASWTGKAFWRTLDSDTVLWEDTGGVTINQSGAATYGDFTYKVAVADQTLAHGLNATGTFRLDFQETISGEVVPCPEDGYVIVEVSA